MKRTLTFALATGLAAATPAFAFGGPGHHRPSFADLDADGNGTVSSEEFVTPATERFADIDENGDGSVVIAEFTAPMLERFAAIDADDDGVLTQDELRAAHPRRHR
jgi:Ca2+-binding EF-hand superfamily protein